MGRNVWLSVSLACVLGATSGCGSSGGGNGYGDVTDDGGGTTTQDATTTTSNDGSAPGDAAMDASNAPPSLVPEAGGDVSSATGPLTISPSTLQTITVTAGQTTPTVAFSASLGSTPVSAAWTLDRGDLATVGAGPSTTATVAPTGTTGGLVTIIAGVNGQTVKAQVFIQLTAKQNGQNTSAASEQGQIAGSTAQLSQGGGIGGVGGEGIGLPVTDPTTLGALANPSSSTTDAGTEGLAFLYPYDKTIWPRGLLAPLLMWTWAPANADAIQIGLKTTSGSFSWTGTFGPPAVLAGQPFVHHPIPQDVWDMATNSAGGPTPTGVTDQLVVSLTVAKNGLGYGPVSETWTIAPTRLSGTVYYNSYGTQYVKNWATKDKAGNTIGAAILGIHSGDLAPHLVAGVASTDDSGCRVCHVVSSRGGWMITQSEQGSPLDAVSYFYNLAAPNVQASSQELTQTGTFPWAAMTSDGAYALTNSVDPASTNQSVANASKGSATSSYWQFGATPSAFTQLTLGGLPTGLAAAYPSFSPDDTKIAYVDATGSTNDIAGKPIKIANYSVTSQSLSNVLTVQTPASTGRIGYPVFLPDDSGILFESQVRKSTSDTVLVTQLGARSELWWVTPAGVSAPLATLNGKSAGTSYLPILPNNHGIAGASDPRDSYSETGFDDTTLNYEPTILPIVEGGYAWVVFTSRRAYGNELGSVPWNSWPPYYDTTDLSQATVKKLWVAAIDLNAPAGTDPSHPAFYLPAQEILAGNSRGFWVLDPCQADGTSCETGDQCCNGYCEPNGDAGALVCSNTPPNATCAGSQEKCTATLPCCDSTQSCINGFCAAEGQK